MTQGLRILVVEDEPNTGQAVQRFLEYRGHEVRVARNASRAIEVAEELSPEVLVCDWKLAGNGDGVEVAGKVRAMNEIPVIMVTGHSLVQARNKARESNVDITAYRRKPVSLSDLASLIESLEIAN